MGAARRANQPGIGQGPAQERCPAGVEIRRPRGVRLFGAVQADLRCIETIQNQGAEHVRYQVR